MLNEMTEEQKKELAKNLKRYLRMEFEGNNPTDEIWLCLMASKNKWSDIERELKIKITGPWNR